MTTDPTTKSGFYRAFKADINAASEIRNNPLLNRLIFAHVVTVMEQYLCDLFLHEISSDPIRLQRLANHSKFKQRKLEVAFALNQSVSDWMIAIIKNLVWHRLNDIQSLYKEILDISFDLERAVLDGISKRHHLVHRNGFDLHGNVVSVSDNDLTTLIDTIDCFISKIDEKYTGS